MHLLQTPQNWQYAIISSLFSFQIEIISFANEL